MRIRLANADDLALLPVIEASAGQAFRGSSQSSVADHPVPAPEVYAPFIAKNLSWIAELDEGPVGFVMCEPFADALHIWELAVRLDRQRQGVGRVLMTRAIQAASALALPAATLSTFRSIPWNAPFYASLGFRQVDPDDPLPRIAHVAALEAEHGLDMAQRCFMRLAL